MLLPRSKARLLRDERMAPDGGPTVESIEAGDVKRLSRAGAAVPAWYSLLDEYAVEHVVLDPASDHQACAVMREQPHWRIACDRGYMLHFVRDASHAAAADAVG